MFYKVYTGPTAFPPQVARPGTFTTVGKTVTFNTSPYPVAIGDWLYSPSLNEVRRVTKLPGFPTAIIDSPFLSDLTNEDVYVVQVECCNCCYTQVSITNFGLANGLLNQEIFPKCTVQNIGVSPCSGPCIVFTIDATGTEISILAT